MSYGCHNRPAFKRSHFAQNGWVLDDNGWSICGAALGIYLADRSLFKRGK